MADQTILPYAVGRNTIDNVPAGTAGSVAGYTQITSSNDGIFQPPANGRYLISILDFTGAATVTIKATDSSGNPLNDWGAAVGDIAVTTPALIYRRCAFPRLSPTSTPTGSRIWARSTPARPALASTTTSAVRPVRIFGSNHRHGNVAIITDRHNSSFP